MQTAIPIQTKTQKVELKSRKILLFLALAELGIGLFFILLEAIADGLISRNYFYWLPCTYGTGVWVGVLGVISGVFGFFAFRTIYGNRCLMITHFVMAIIAAVADAILLMMASICMVNLPHALERQAYYNSQGRGDTTYPPSAYHKHRFIIALEAFLIIFALVHMVLSIVSTALICRNWCAGTSSTVTVIYLPNQQDGMTKDGHPVGLPAGAQVMFVQSGQQVPQTLYPQQQ